MTGFSRPARWMWPVGILILVIIYALVVVVNRSLAVPSKAVFIGDSYTFGVGATSPERRWTTLVSRAEGWQEDNRGLGGTGYLATSGPNGCGRPFCESYSTVIEQAAGDAPGIVVIAGGQNDFVRYATDRQQVVDAIQLTYRTARRVMPDATIVAVGPSTTGPVDDLVKAFDAAVQDAAKAVDARYISLIDPAVLDPTMVLPDRAHVGDVGHQAIAQRVIGTLR